MLTALLTAIAFIVGTFAERIIWAVVTLLVARWVMRRLRAIKVRLTRAARPWAAAASHKWRMAKTVARMVFGPTVWVRAAA